MRKLNCISDNIVWSLLTFLSENWSKFLILVILALKLSHVFNLRYFFFWFLKTSEAPINQGKIVNFRPVFGAGAIRHVTMRTRKHWQQLVWWDEGRRHRPPLLHTDPESKYDNLTSCCQCFFVLMVALGMAPAPNTGQKFTILPCKNNKRWRKYATTSMIRWRPTPPTSTTTHWSKIKIQQSY